MQNLDTACRRWVGVQRRVSYQIHIRVIILFHDNYVIFDKFNRKCHKWQEYNPDKFTNPIYYLMKICPCTTLIKLYSSFTGIATVFCKGNTNLILEWYFFWFMHIYNTIVLLIPLSYLTLKLNFEHDQFTICDASTGANSDCSACSGLNCKLWANPPDVNCLFI